MMFERFCIKRMSPKIFLSYNAKTSKAKALKTFLAIHRIWLRFNLTRASWWGGLFKKLIHCTERCLGKCGYKEFLTVLTEVKGVLNSGPLMNKIWDDDNLTGCLKPSHLYYGYLKPVDDDYQSNVETEIIRSKTCKRQRLVKHTFDHFWIWWKN